MCRTGVDAPMEGVGSLIEQTFVLKKYLNVTMWTHVLRDLHSVSRYIRFGVLVSTGEIRFFPIPKHGDVVVIP